MINPNEVTPAKKNKNTAAPEEKGDKPVVTKQVCALPYYHGLLPREDIKSMLKTDGDFLLRITEPNPGQPRSLVISVCDPRDNPRHFVIQTDGTSCFIEPHQKHPDVINLVRAYHRITLGGTVLLKTPIHRQAWEVRVFLLELP
uniref:SH2 domain-containing protein n=1 Tax=Panagrolaimus superbus TaxID=310955 RepID=A0A914YG39_9BILA